MAQRQALPQTVQRKSNFLQAQLKDFSQNIVFGFTFAGCLGLVKMTWDLSQVSVHAPAIREMPGRPASDEGPSENATKSHESSTTELSDTR